MSNAARTQAASAVPAELATSLRQLAADILDRCHHGWDAHAARQMHAALAPLVAELQPLVHTATLETVLKIRTVLTPAAKRQRSPDAATAALLIALSHELRRQLGAVDSAREPPGKYRVLLVGLHENAAKFTLASLETQGNLEALHIAEPLAVLEQLSKFQPHLIVLNHDMPVCGCDDLSDMIRTRQDFADVPIIQLVTGDGPADSSERVVSINQQPEVLARAITSHLPPRPPESVATRERTTHRHGRRRWLLDRLEATLISVGRNRGALLEIGIDSLNATELETLHQQWPTIQLQMRQLISGALQIDDILASNDTGFLLLARGRDAAHLHALGDQLLSRLQRERFGAEALPLTVSIGGCVLDSHLDQVDAVLNSAHHTRRAAGPDAIAWARHDHSDIDARMLADAIDDDRIYLVFQAIVSLTGEPLPRYQALLRMRDDAGLVHPAAEILPVAQDAGRVAELDNLSLERSIQLLARHQQRAQPLQLFVNQSAESLDDPDYPRHLAKALRRHNTRGRRLVLDFRCSDIAAEPEKLLRVAAYTRTLGVSLCLSGVGGGRHARSLLQTLPLDYIKLVPELRARPAGTLLNAHARKAKVIATRVDNDHQLELLRKYGIDLAQGHRLAHPSRTVNYRFNGTR